MTLKERSEVVAQSCIDFMWYHCYYCYTCEEADTFSIYMCE